MISSGIKTEKSDIQVTDKFVDDHINIGIDALKELREGGRTVKHLQF